MIALLTLLSSTADARPVDGPRLGIEVVEMTPQLRVHNGAPEQAGVLVGSVVPGSAADAAGLQVGDVLVGVGKQDVGGVFDIVSSLRNGANELRVIRDGKPITLTAKLKKKGEVAPAEQGEEAWEAWGDAYGERWERWAEELQRNIESGVVVVPRLPRMPTMPEEVPADTLVVPVEPGQRSRLELEELMDRLEDLEQRLQDIEAQRP